VRGVLQHAERRGSGMQQTVAAARSSQKQHEQENEVQQHA
jgi:hypothetical protein